MWLHDLQIEITLAKSEKFDELMAAANEDKEAAEAQEQNWNLFFCVFCRRSNYSVPCLSLLKHFWFILILAHFECYRGLWCSLYLWTFLFTDRIVVGVDKIFFLHKVFNKVINYVGYGFWSIAIKTMWDVAYTWALEQGKLSSYLLRCLEQKCKAHDQRIWILVTSCVVAITRLFVISVQLGYSSLTSHFGSESF